MVCEGLFIYRRRSGIFYIYTVTFGAKVYTLMLKILNSPNHIFTEKCKTCTVRRFGREMREHKKLKFRILAV